MKFNPVVALILITSVGGLKAQSIINAYAKVTNVSGTTLTVSNVNEANDSFEVGENIIVMQMQDNVIGGNTGDNSNFGNIASIGSAGLYEQATIASLGESLGSFENIWSDDFSTYGNGTTTGSGTPAWTRGCTGGGTGCYTTGNARLDTRGPGYFEGRNINTEGYWTSNAIDITGFININISIDLLQAGYENNGDYVRAYYSIDGGTPVFLTNGNRSNNFAAITATASLTGLSNSTLTLYVRMMSNGTSGTNDDQGRFDNVSVQGQRYYPSSITITSALANSYSTGANSSLQIISFPEFVNYTTSADLTALPWDGNVGGVFAIDVNNTLTLANKIYVNAQGFTGGIPNPTADGSGCDPNTYITNSNSYARKGASVYKISTTNYQAARGKVANGGGGGNFHNAGGGGGGNFTAGGDGGPGWNGTTGGCSPSSGGLGGIDLSTYITASRVFMGGGGGGGQQNNNLSDAGGAGGGIIIIRASTIQTNGGCGGLSITANGQSRGLAGNDGGAGAGAGGSIIFQVSNWTLSCQLDAEAKGGDGGSVNSTQAHGGGGGGGKGVLIFSSAVPVTNFSTNNSEGTGGSNGTDPGAGTAVPGSTTPSAPSADPDGVIPASEGPLPVELLNWNGKDVDNRVLLTWTTASENSNHYFTIEKSSDAQNWSILQIVEGNGTTDSKTYYDLIDENPMPPTNYYRLSQTDYDGTTEVFDVISVKLELFATNLLLYPNPTSGTFRIKLPDALMASEYTIQMFDVNGRAVAAEVMRESGEIIVDASALSTGYYFVKVAVGNYVQNIKVIID